MRPSMSRASSAIEWRTQRRLIRRSSAGSNGRASRRRIDGRSVTCRSRRRAAGEPRDRLERPVDLGRGVVVDEPEAQDAAGLGLAEPLDEAGRVEVAVPGVDARAGRAPPRPRAGWTPAIETDDGRDPRRRTATRSVMPWIVTPSIASRPSMRRVTSVAFVVGDGDHPGDELAPALAARARRRARRRRRRRPGRRRAGSRWRRACRRSPRRFGVPVSNRSCAGRTL